MNNTKKKGKYIWNQSKLIEGKIYKNYKELCGDLELEVKTGNARESQFKDISRYCEIEKEGHKIKIIKIYDKKLDKEDKRKGNKNRSIYGDIVELLVLDYLNKQNSKSVTISKTNLLQHVGLANRNYVSLKNYPQKLANYIGYNILYVQDFYSINDTKLKRIVERALNSLEDKRLIFYESIIKLKRLGESNQKTASLVEKNYILDVEKDTMISYGFERMSTLRNSHKWRFFKKEVDNILRDTAGIQYYYSAYEIAINQKHINKEKEKLENDILKIFNNEFNTSEKTYEVNELIVKNINENALKRNSDISKKGTKYEYRLSKAYLEASEKLSRMLISYNSSMLLNDVLNYKKENEQLEIIDISDILPF